MFKTAGRLINFKTLFLVAIYIFFKSDNKNITTYEIKEESMSPALLPEDYVLACLLYTSPSPRDISGSRMPSSA